MVLAKKMTRIPRTAAIHLEEQADSYPPKIIALTSMLARFGVSVATVGSTKAECGQTDGKLQLYIAKEYDV